MESRLPLGLVRGIVVKHVFDVSICAANEPFSANAATECKFIVAIAPDMCQPRTLCAVLAMAMSSAVMIFEELGRYSRHALPYGFRRALLAQTKPV